MTTARLLLVVDIVIVVLLAATAQLDAWQSRATLTGGWPVHAALAAGATLPLLARRRYPLAVASAVAIASWLQYELGGGLYQPWFALLLALYALGAHATLRAAVLGTLPVAAAVAWIDGPRVAAGAPIDEVLPAWVVLGLSWGLGRWVRRRRREHEELRRSAQRLEGELQEASARAVADERARIARELHDLVAHSMSVINLQAQGARRVAGTDPDATTAALSAIESASRHGLDELRRMLSLLRATDEGTERAPQPTIEDLPALVDRVREAGLEVRYAVRGEERQVSPGVELSAYRIVQEALTNALKHGGGPASVSVAYRAGGVELEVVNARPAASSEAATIGAGRGLIGMRERVTLFGGSFEAAAAPDGTFVVRARLPATEAAR
jgi:signal transduction histidine kinase